MSDSYDINTLESGPYPTILKQPAQTVSFPLSDEDKHIIEYMQRKLIAINGVGLAAVQIGIPKKIIVFMITEEQKSLRIDGFETVPLTVLINPSYVPLTDATLVQDWEACFSVESKSGKVPRHSKIAYQGYLPDGTLVDNIAQGFTARVIQHEIDHINGLLIVDRLTPDCIQGHPNEMMSQRYSEFNKQQKKIVAKMLEERLAKVAEDDHEGKLAIHNLQRLIGEDKP